MDRLFQYEWMSVLNKHVQEVNDWLIENVGANGVEWYMTWDGCGMSGWMINKPEDAIAFKLRFGS